MEKEFSHEKLTKQFDALSLLLKNPNLSEEGRKELNNAQTVIAVNLMNSWLPRDLGRKLIMLVILIVGISGTMAGNSSWLFILLILPLFSPRIVRRISIIIGYLKGNHKK
jgi:hypothetical protein